MFKINKLLVLFLMLSLVGICFASGAEYQDFNKKDIVLKAPQRIGLLDRFQIKFEIEDDDAKDLANVIDFSGCDFFILNDHEIKNEALIKKGYTNPLLYYEYNGEKEVVLEVGPVFYPYPSFKDEKWQCMIYFRRVFDEKDRLNPPKRADDSSLSEEYNKLAEINYEYVAVPIRIEATFPYEQENVKLDTPYLSGHTVSGKSATFYYDIKFVNYGYEYNKTAGYTKHYYGKDYIFDMKKPDYKQFFEEDIEDFEKAKFIGSTKQISDEAIKGALGSSGYYKVYHSVYDVREFKKDEEDKVSITSYYMGRINYHGPTNLAIKITKGNYETKKEDTEQTESQAEEDLVNAVKSIKIVQEDIDYPTYEKVKETKKEEKKDVKDREFKIKFSSDDEKTIWNRGRKNTGKEDDVFQILVKIDAIAKDEKGKKIKNPSTEDLYKDVYLVARLSENKSQVLLDQKDVREIKAKVSSDLSTIDVAGKGPHLYKGAYKPVEYVQIHLEDGSGKALSDNLTYKIKIKDASPKIDLKKPLIEVQDGDKRGVSFTVEDKDSTNLKCRIMVPTGFAYKSKISPASIEYDNQQTTLVNIDCKQAETITFIYHAPNLGNFDLNGEMDALSMWKFQQDTATNLVTDLVGVGVEKRLEFLGNSEDLYRRFHNLDPKDYDTLKKAHQLGEAKDFLDNANQISTHTQNAIKVTQSYKTAKDLNKDLEEAKAEGKQGWTEWGSDWGVLGIDVAQTAVGAISMAPKNVPIVGELAGKITAKLGLSFNLMTNVWKGNLQYLSKVEKINRAQEFYFPYPVIIEVEDEDGFKNTEIQNVMIVYNWLEK